MSLARHARSEPSLVSEVRRGSTLLTLVAAVPLLCTLLATAYVLQVLQPRVEHSTQVTRDLRLLHEGMVDQETGLRAWLATGDRGFLQPYVEGVRATEAAQRRLHDQVRLDLPLRRRVVDVLVEATSWRQEWAAEAAQAEVAGQGGERLTPLLEDGKRRFDGYRQVYGTAVGLAAAQRDDAVADQRRALSLLLGVDLLLVAVAVVVVGPRRRRLVRLVEAPLQQLHAAILRVVDGAVLDTARLGVVELDEVAQALGQLSREARDERRTAKRRTEDALDLAGRLELVLRASRAMSSCTDAAQVAAAVTAAAQELTGTRAGLWTVDDRGRWHEADVQGPVGDVPPDVAAVVALAAAGERAVPGADGTAWPLVGAGEVLAVLHVARAEGGGNDQEGVAMEALALAGAASLRAVHLAQALRERASTDALTGLRNRYELDRDLTAEWSRSVRHDREMSFCLLDLDHFKRLNDTEGHQAGDTWLRRVSDAVAQQVRAEDAVYRYGGEEIAVLLRDSDEHAAAAFAERCRAAVEALRGPGGSVTTSIGVAARTGAMHGPADLVAAADQALYAAKGGGRNLVVRASAARVLATISLP